MSINISNEAAQVRIAELEQRLAEAQITKHSGDCRWWSCHICDCGYLMRANSGDCGEPLGQVVKDWLEHSANCQQVKDTPLVQILEQRLKESEARAAQMRDVLFQIQNEQLHTQDSAFRIWDKLTEIARKQIESIDCGKGWRSPEEWAQLEAEAAALREALEAFVSAVTTPEMFFAVGGKATDGLKRAGELSKNALSSSAGKAMLERLERYEEALERLSRLGNEPNVGNSIGNQIATEALKAKE